MGGLVLLEDVVLIAIIFIFIVWWRILPVIVIIAGCHGFTELGMMMHGICTHGKIVHTAGTDEPQVVVHGPQVVDYGPLILSFLPTPKAEGQSTPSSQGLRGMNPLQAHDFWQLGRHNNPKEMDIFREGCSSLVGGLEIFLASP